MKVDVAIIGAGPAGGMAACTLASSGLSTIILEQKQLPRAKACGGLMPAGMERLFNWDIEALVRQRANHFQFFNNYSEEFQRPAEAPGLLLVDRAQFDAGLVQRALSSGEGRVSIREGFRVQGLVESAEAVQISGQQGGSLEAASVIIADGANSRSARALGLNPEPVCAPAIDAEIELDAELAAQYANRVLFNYFCLPHGYGWIFPKGSNVLSCGVGHWGSGLRLPAAMEEFLQRNFPEGAIRSRELRGHPIPVFRGEYQLASARCCLAGDAASLVDPVTGEGIRYALLSGKAAADAIIRLHTGSSAPLSEVLDYRPITRHLDKLARFASLPFEQAPNYFYQHYIASDAKARPYS